MLGVFIMSVITATKVRGGGVKYKFIRHPKPEKMIQKRLRKTGLKKPEAKELSSLAKDCVQPSQGSRPTTTEIARVLDHLAEKISLKRSFKERLKALVGHT